MYGKNYSLGSASRDNTDELSQFNRGRVIYVCKVIDDVDPNGAGLIKVRIVGLDDKKLDSELPYCWPFLPLYLNVRPKKGEIVKIILYEQRNNDSYREYIGPILPQLGEFLEGTETFDQAMAGREGVGVPFYQSIFTQELTKELPRQGIPALYPKQDEIAIQGRENSDVIFKNSEVLIRAAKFLPNKPQERNIKNPAYIQIKSLTPGKYESNTTVNSTENQQQKSILAKEKYNETRTDIKMVSNKIYLIGRDSSSSIIKPFMTEKEQSSIETKLHPVVYGDILKDFIKKLFKWAQTHTHAYHNVPQNPASDGFIGLQRWMVSELPKLNSKNIFAGGDTPNNNLNKIDPNKVDNNDFDKGEVVERDNTNQPEPNDPNSLPPQLEIKGQKFCLEGACRVDIRVIDLVSGEILESFSGENSNLVVAYTSTMAKLQTYLLFQGIKLPIPQLDDLENF